MSTKDVKTILESFIGALFITLVLSCSPGDREPGIVSKPDFDLVLIPGGEFLMGKDGESEHSPAHSVYIDSFYIDAYEVTNSQYLAFCEETGHRLPEFWGMDAFHCGPGFAKHPVVGVSWSDAEAYAEWAGKRLPTEAEWEYAARGGLVGKNYPVGDDLDSTLANFTMKGKTKGSAPVGSYPPNGYGLYDMVGNVVEWVSDYYAGDYYSASPYENPTGPEKGKFRVIRGGGWHSGPYCNSVFFRNALPGGWVDINVGFRCAKGIQKK
ncbi:MAG: formylglycine-generating enzyme family protein [Gemmatimonadota bacterium]|nr:MAG: formylglycine-generating enzyme family protein [Gemmatimonadota bacterium]